MKRKLLAMLTLAVMLFSTSLFTACGGGSTNSGNDVETEVYEALTFDKETPVTIKFYHTMGQNLKDVLDLYIPVFNEIYPNITISHEQVGGYDDVKDQIKTEITQGLQPNIAYCYPDHVAMYNVAKATETLDKFINNPTAEIALTEAQIADFIPAYYEEGRQFGDGKMYTMPLSKSTEVLYYNKTFFEANNLQVPTTWEQMEEVCRQIKAIDETCVPLGYDSEANWFITMTEQLGTPYTSNEKGEDHYQFDDPRNHAFIKEFREWYQDGLVTTQDLYGSYTSGLFVAQEGTKSYMSIGSSAGATHQRPAMLESGEYPFEVGIASIPQANAENKKVISQGPSLCIFKKDNQQEVIASWLFVKFLTTNVEFQAEFSMASGYVPVLKSVAQNEGYAGWLANANGGSNVAALSIKVCLEQADYYYTSPAFNGSSTARDQVGLLLRKCISDESEEALANIDAFIAKEFASAVEECEYAE